MQYGVEKRQCVGRVLWRLSLLAGDKQAEVESVEHGYPTVNDRRVSVEEK